MVHILQFGKLRHRTVKNNPPYFGQWSFYCKSPCLPPVRDQRPRKFWHNFLHLFFRQQAFVWSLSSNAASYMGFDKPQAFSKPGSFLPWSLYPPSFTEMLQLLKFPSTEGLCICLLSNLSEFANLTFLDFLSTSICSSRLQISQAKQDAPAAQQGM